MSNFDKAIKIIMAQPPEPRYPSYYADLLREADVPDKNVGDIEALKILVDEQPTVEAEPVWIPCSERLPEDFGEYLVTKKAIGWNCEEYNSIDIAYFDNEGFHKATKVLAWRPLPEPYEGQP